MGHYLKKIEHLNINQIIKVDIFLDKYVLGNYSFKVKYRIGDKNYEILTSPVIIDTLGYIEKEKIAT